MVVQFAEALMYNLYMLRHDGLKFWELESAGSDMDWIGQVSDYSVPEDHVGCNKITCRASVEREDSRESSKQNCVERAIHRAVANRKLKEGVVFM